MEPRTGRTKPHPKSLAVGALLTFLIALGQISNSIYIPSMPALVKAFDTGMEQVNLTFTVFLVGFAISQIVYGPFSDRFGRRRVLLGGLVLYFVASVACTISFTIEILITARFAQAVGACAGPVMTYAIVRDVYERKHAARVLAYINVAFAISPAIMPLIGGYLQAWFGWRANFLFLSAVAGSAFLAVWLMLNETITQSDPRATRPSRIALTFVMLLRSPEFLGHMLSVAFIFAGLMAYQASSSFLFINTLGLSPERFGLLSAFIVVGYLTGTLAAGRWTLRFGIESLVMAGTLLALTGGVAMAAIALTGHLSVAAIIGPMMLYMAGMGLVMPNAIAGAMGPFPQVAGTASALLGFCQMAIAAAASLVVGWMSQRSQLPLALAITVSAAIAATAFTALVWRRRV
jgi:DHA1 family bicyclomycin/chloramphenicol resistance-like MFS transporter